MSDIALVGNPNCGKTTLFNHITGSHEYTGNWPGVTIERKIGEYTYSSKPYQLIDLPGIYNLSPLSKDESITTYCLIYENINKIINIVDASQLERSLYLTIQLLEFEKPTLIALNMSDVAHYNGIHVDYDRLADLLKIPVVPTNARKHVAIESLKQKICEPMEEKNCSFYIDYGIEVEHAIKQLENHLPSDLGISKRWLSIQFLEKNPVIELFLNEKKNDLQNMQSMVQIRDDLERKLDLKDSSSSIARQFRAVRRACISTIIAQVESRKSIFHNTFTSNLDRIVSNPYLGIPVFLILMYGVFKITFDWVGTPISDKLSECLETFISPLFEQTLISIGASMFVVDLVVTGLIGGVGGVLVFLPQIVLLFFMISILEDSGYMTRIAFVMDRFMQLFGLNGKAFIPMIIGFGCNVPGIMAARTIEQPKERLFTILLMPMMSCSARLPVYSLFVGTFFVQHQSFIVFSLYVLGIIVALITAKIVSVPYRHDHSSVFFIEWPTYQIPHLKSLCRNTWDKAKSFVRKAGTFILGGSVFIWLLSYLGPAGTHVEINKSLLSIIGGWLAPVFAPLGFASWEACVAIITGFLAKEVVISTMNIIYTAPGHDTLSSAIQQHFTPWQAISFMVFVLLYIPCLATVAVIRKETCSLKWTWFSIIYGLLIAYVLSYLIYQIGSRLH
jgi:ferrous iron transport protein B